MAENERDNEQHSERTAVNPGYEDVLRQQLIRRIGIAGVLIVALIGSLALFDAVFVPDTSAPAVKKAMPVQSTMPDMAPDKSAETATPVDAPSATASDKAQETAPETAPIAPTETKPGDTSKSAPSSTPAAPVTKQITRPDVKAAAPVKAAPEVAAAPTLPPVAPPPAASTAKPEPAQKESPPLHPLSSGYLVQMGVFSNLSNAEDLKSRLDKAGIPSHIEARVQVGPFKNKAEAEAARKKLADMGLSGLLLSPRK
ncbi:MAG TPA: SPOR domain-containing protein [Rhodocyclaceae bacterium]|nr:SPOR domain-containing protein [Rhodocyclaceae bacterium]